MTGCRNLNQLSKTRQLLRPYRVWPVTSEDLLHLGSAAPGDGFEVRHGLASPNNRVALFAVLDTIEYIQFERLAQDTHPVSRADYSTRVGIERVNTLRPGS